MKITLGNINYNGYANLGFVRSLDPFVENSECTEILAPNILNYIEAERVQDFIVHLVSKLRHGGTITLGGNDIIVLATYIITQPANTDIISLNKMVFGDGNQRPICCQLHCNVVADMLQKLGLKILKKRLEGHEFTVEAMRP